VDFCVANALAEALEPTEVSPDVSNR
jgi:hypothetical protein